MGIIGDMFFPLRGAFLTLQWAWLEPWHTSICGHKIEEKMMLNYWTEWTTQCSFKRMWVFIGSHQFPSSTMITCDDWTSFNRFMGTSSRTILLITKLLGFFWTGSLKPILGFVGTSSNLLECGPWINTDESWLFHNGTLLTSQAWTSHIGTIEMGIVGIVHLPGPAIRLKHQYI